MVGSGNRRDDVAHGISSTNVFAALETLKKKKKSSSKDQKGSSKTKGSSKAEEKEQELSQVVWVPAPLNKSWADVDDDDDEYYKSAPVLSGWGSGVTQKRDSGPPESESEDDGLDDGDDDIEDEAEAPLPAELTVTKVPCAPVAPKDPERQLSKKAQKKKELEELDALLAELGMSSKEDRVIVSTEEKNPGEQRKDGDKENAAAIAESKDSKKRKGKKEKSSKEAKDENELGNDANGSVEVTATGAMVDPDARVDMKERLKKVASMKKKKSGKEMDNASKIAAIEAAARSVKLAALKKKEKSHYNQQPLR